MSDIELEDLPQKRTELPQSFERFETIDRVSDVVNIHSFIGKEWIILTLMSILIGLIAGFLNVFTELLVNWKNGHYCKGSWLTNEHFCPESQWVKGTSNIALFVTMSVIYIGIAALMVQMVPLATGSGISEIKVIVSGFRLNGFLDWMVLVVKSMGLSFSIASGLSVGKEGPSVHYAVAAGHTVGSWFSYVKDDILVASSAAGVAVAFGSPIGGVLFAIEDIAHGFRISTMWKCYYAALVATSVLQFLNPFNNGKIVVFEVTFEKQWHLKEIACYVILGIAGGLYGLFVCKFNIQYVKFRKEKLANWPVYEVLGLAFFTAVISYFNRFLKMDMTEGIGMLFSSDQEFNFWSLLVATVVRVGLVIISYGAKVPAGIFVPSMAVGATFGRALGVVVSRFWPDVNQRALAFLGAGAFLSGITNLTITVVVIMFELTGAFFYIIPTMIVVAVTASLGRGGIAERMIVVNGMPYLENEPVKARDVMTRKIVALNDPSELSMLDAYDFKGYPLVKEDKLVGYVKKDGTVSQPIVVSLETNVVDIFNKLGPRIIFVEDKGSLQGLITKKDVANYQRH